MRDNIKTKQKNKANYKKQTMQNDENFKKMIINILRDKNIMLLKSKKQKRVLRN